MDREKVEKPIHRGDFRLLLGMKYYEYKRKLQWIKMKKVFATNMGADLKHQIFSHQTPLLRKLKDVDMQYQYNKIVNLKIASKKLNGIILKPGEVFSYWYLIGKTTKRKGYVDGMVLNNGGFGPGIGGGICQMSNLIYWMTIHTPLKIIERHRHGFDVFPDANRTQPFGSGATCFYPHGDLMIQNTTNVPYQLKITVGEHNLEGEWRSSEPLNIHYQIIEKNHLMRPEYWDGYTRHNELFRQVFDSKGIMIDEEFVVSNSAIMMYSPFIDENNEG